MLFAATDPNAFEVIRDILGVPVIAALVAAFASFLVPTARWGRSLKQALEVAGGLPEGVERDRWETRATRLARQLREYRTYIPLPERVIGWSIVATFGLLPIVVLVDGFRVPEDPTEWVLYSFGLLSIYPALNVLRGRTTSGYTPKEYGRRSAFNERYARASDKKRHRAEAAKRFRRLRRRVMTTHIRLRDRETDPGAETTNPPVSKPDAEGR